jgi:hypothetical protein
MTSARAVAALLCVAVSISAALARERAIEEVESVTAYSLDRLKPSAIVFTDHSLSNESASGPAPGLIAFENWSRSRPDEKQLLGLYPEYVEPAVARTIGGVRRQIPEKVIMYVAKARFLLDRPLASQELARYTTLSFAEHVDPAIKHKLIAPAEAAPLTNPRAAHNRNPARPWCAGNGAVCLRSHYRLEGKLPLGIALVNKLRDANKKIADYLEFESELAVRTPEELEQAKIKRLTRLDAPIVGVLEQTTFYVNQVLEFGKALVVFQRHPNDAKKTVVTAFMAIAIEGKLLTSKKDYAKVPVLRNLVPVQVLMGKSSFNTGSSISAGLPNYARSRVRAIARILDGE